MRKDEPVLGSGHYNFLSTINEAKNYIEDYRESDDFIFASDLLAEAHNTQNAALRDLILSAGEDFMVKVQDLVDELDNYIKSLAQ